LTNQADRYIGSDAAHYAKRSIKGQKNEDLICFLCREAHLLKDCPTRKTLIKMARSWELNHKKGKSAKSAKSAKSNEKRGGDSDEDAAIAYSYSSSDLSDNEAW
jgi:hypothetical protein